MSHRGPVILAVVLLVAAVALDLDGWWNQNDVWALESVRETRLVGRMLETALGSNRPLPKLTLAVDASYPPFASVDADGKLVGFEVELSESLGERIALQSTVVNMDTGDGTFDALSAQKIDAIVAGIGYDPEPPKTVALSNPYFEAGPVVVVKAGREDIHGPTDLSGKRVAVEVGTLGEEQAQSLGGELPEMSLVDMSDPRSVIDAVAGGTVDAAVLDRASVPMGSPIMEQLRIVGDPLVSQPYMIVVRRQDYRLLLAINRELAALKAEGMLGSMEKKWFR